MLGVGLTIINLSPPLRNNGLFYIITIANGSGVIASFTSADGSE